MVNVYCTKKACNNRALCGWFSSDNLDSLMLLMLSMLSMLLLMRNTRVWGGFRRVSIRMVLSLARWWKVYRSSLTELCLKQDQLTPACVLQEK